MEVDIGRTARGRRSASAGPSSAFFLSKLPMTGIYCEYLDTKAFGLLDIMISLHWQSRFFFLRRVSPRWCSIPFKSALGAHITAQLSTPLAVCAQTNALTASVTVRSVAMCARKFENMEEAKGHGRESRVGWESRIRIIVRT